MSFLAKDSDAVLDYTVDWSARLEEGEAILASDWLIAPVETGGLALVSQAGEGSVRTASISGGVARHVYRLTNRVTTSAGRTDDSSFLIRITET